MANGNHVQSLDDEKERRYGSYTSPPSFTPIRSLDDVDRMLTQMRLSEYVFGLPQARPFEEVFVPSNMSGQESLIRRLARDQVRALQENVDRAADRAEIERARTAFNLFGPNFVKAITGANINTRLDEQLRSLRAAEDRAFELEEQTRLMPPRIQGEADLRATQLAEESRVGNLRGLEEVRARNAEREAKSLQSFAQLLNDVME